MATLVNRDVVVIIGGAVIQCRCIAQSATGNWIKVRHPDGHDEMVHSRDFVRVAEDPFDYGRELKNQRDGDHDER